MVVPTLYFVHFLFGKSRLDCLFFIFSFFNLVNWYTSRGPYSSLSFLFVCLFCITVSTYTYYLLVLHIIICLFIWHSFHVSKVCGVQNTCVMINLPFREFVFISDLLMLNYRCKFNWYQGLMDTISTYLLMSITLFYVYPRDIIHVLLMRANWYFCTKLKWHM